MLTPIDHQKLENDATLREAYDLRVFVVGGGFQYIKMFLNGSMK